VGADAKTAPRPIIVRKVVAEAATGHHGGAWKVAYADFVTAMMAFFLLMWLLGSTTEKQRKALADYFSPTLVQTRQESAGAHGMFGGESLVSADKYPRKASQTGTKTLTIPKDASGGAKEGASRAADAQHFANLRQLLAQKLRRDDALKAVMRNVRFQETRLGLQIDILDDAAFEMFQRGTARLTPQAYALMTLVASVVNETSNALVIRGHTDASPFSNGTMGGNWQLSSARAETTRQMLALKEVNPDRFFRLEGVADREPFNPIDRFDPKNRRISITLLWQSGEIGSNDGQK
jgi:chemotaxis protein MotB